METVAIVGVGLIGGSFGLALKKAGFRGTILGVSSEASVRAGIRAGAIDRGATLEQAARAADLLYLAQPIGRILDTLHHLDPLVRPQALVTDAGSTKHAIVTEARRLVRRCQFLGGHPLAGKEKRGAAAAEADLFRGRTYVLTPASPDELRTPAASVFVDWLSRIGAKTVTLGAAEHDRLVSFTSHLPQLASTALAATVAENLTAPEDLQVAGPGLIDSTRLAMSAYELWRDILATNTESIEQALTAYINELEQLRDNLRTRGVRDEFARAAELAGRLRAR
ncbi:MAG TPA: prephenate dehydrogenase/arogenate dehydrogenase family protein [Bryobacteraceae bacterium]|jgi:prephenate dehydrogenase|nr:prephenate dehydrogenase/arogenate dehydrogenase family protein [Bryobacteraceae bacterium]